MTAPSKPVVLPPNVHAVFGAHDEGTLAQLAQVAQRARAVSLMADGHLGYIMPVGGVAAYRNQASVVGVGFDISCGVAALKTDVSLDALAGRPELERIADAIQDTLSFGIGRKNTADDSPVDHPLFRSDAWDLVPPGPPPGAQDQGAPAARHDRIRQPLRRSPRRRGGRALGDGPLRVAGTRPHDRVRIPRPGAGEALGRARAGSGGPARPRRPVRARLLAPHESRRRVRQVLRPGRVTPEMMREWLEGKGVILRGGGLDESPHAYRRLTDVLAAQGETIRVRHVLRPLVVVMAGADVRDPYKD